MDDLTDSPADSRPPSYRSRMVTRALVGLILGAALLAAPANAEAVSPDVRVMSVERRCGTNGDATYWFHLRNSGEHRRGVRIRIVWQGEGRRQHYSRRVRSHDGRMLRMKVTTGLHVGAVTFRAQRRAIFRVRINADCPTPGAD